MLPYKDKEFKETTIQSTNYQMDVFDSPRKNRCNKNDLGSQRQVFLEKGLIISRYNHLSTFIHVCITETRTQERNSFT